MVREAKKSETIELRVSHAVKQAFMTRCEAEGANASAVLRGCIETYLAGADSKPVENRTMKSILLKPALAAISIAGAAFALHAPALSAPDVAAHFARLDANGDGKVTREELRDAHALKAGHGGKAAPHGAAHFRAAGHEDAAFAAADADEDGALNQAEFAAHLAERHRVMFKKLDADGDGKVGASEFERAHRD